MHPVFKRAGRFVAIIYLLVLHGVVVYFVGERISRSYSQTPSVSDPTQANPAPTPVVDPTFDASTAASSATPAPTIYPAATPLQPAGGLMIPVAGVRPEQLTDTFSDARSEGRVHEAIDIPAAAGTPVMAAGDGQIVKFYDSELGGITIYQLSADGKYFYYYAHLQRRTDDLREGDTVARGKVIGFVGDTGNAGAGNYHLHFSITTAPDPKRYWEGMAINPYPVLKGSASLQ